MLKLDKNGIMLSYDGVLSFLGVAFIVLKGFGQINWSWWWVLAPFWMPVAAMVVVFLVICFIMVLDYMSIGE